MTLPDEMFNSLRAARTFMTEMLDPAVYPRLPKQVRLAARARLKHFPCQLEINRMEEMYKTINTDKNFIVNETNKELQSIAGEMAIANKRLNEVSQALQQVINKP
jgi:hypothetical protein